MLGAQVGETAILSAAGRLFAAGSELRFLEGSFGSMLLANDIGRQGVTMDPGGKAAALTGPGLGVEIAEEDLESHVEDRVVVGG